ncbi:phosphotransferase [Bacillus sp. 03113]|uniref:phosphotransferase n=1 Tax=Bacillus sp. 03113 TaxID=2578211 RepID=UPI001141552F|nr:phosphotransferase [Bacillus sp. 03113]
MMINDKRDDLFSNRLFHFLKKNIPFHLESIKLIRKNVFFIESNNKPFIVKKFRTHSRLSLQKAFTASLKRNGFHQTYQFYMFDEESPLYFEGNYYGCIEYIQPSSAPFSYKSWEDCNDGLQLLKKYHLTSAKLINRYQNNLSSHQLLEKWYERTMLFINNIPIIQQFLPRNVIQELMKWARWSLNGLKGDINYFQMSNQVILHGDVAHHNFLRSKNKDLFLIDFDLINIGPECVDYLQYANRILPFLNWSFEKLTELKIIEPFLHQKSFLYGLGYPADLLREWNRIIRENNLKDTTIFQLLLEFTLNQFEKRKLFFQQIKQMNQNDEWTNLPE